MMETVPSPSNKPATYSGESMWLKPQGYAQIISPKTGNANLDGLQCDEISAGVNEYDTIVCFHCNRVVHVKPRMDPANLGGLCKICMKLICPKCLNAGCTPFEKTIEAVERRYETLRSYGL